MLDDATAEMTERPGFLIRRLHQIHLALFAEECAGFDITPVQYSIMAALGEQAGLDQTRMSEEVGIDRATLTNIIARLEAAGIVRRVVSRLDRRQKLLSLTPKGTSLLGRMAGAVARAEARAVAPLAADERAQFLALLSRLVGAEPGMVRLRG